MKDIDRKAYVFLGTTISAALILFLGSVFITEHFGMRNYIADKGIGFLAFVGSPFAIPLGAWCVWASPRIQVQRWAKVCLLVTNALGIVAAAFLLKTFIFLWRMGPINPG